MANDAGQTDVDWTRCKRDSPKRVLDAGLEQTETDSVRVAALGINYWPASQRLLGTLSNKLPWVLGVQNLVSIANTFDHDSAVKDLLQSANPASNRIWFSRTLDLVSKPAVGAFFGTHTPVMLCQIETSASDLIQIGFFQLSHEFLGSIIPSK